MAMRRGDVGWPSAFTCLDSCDTRVICRARDAGGVDGDWNLGIAPRARGRVRRALHPADPWSHPLTDDLSSLRAISTAAVMLVVCDRGSTDQIVSWKAFELPSLPQRGREILRVGPESILITMARRRTEYALKGRTMRAAALPRGSRAMTCSRAHAPEVAMVRPRTPSAGGTVVAEHGESLVSNFIQTPSVNERILSCNASLEIRHVEPVVCYHLSRGAARI
jgi:hypothetical protein